MRISTVLLATACVAGLHAPGARAAENGKFRLGIVTFLSGAAAGPFGVPSGNAAKVLIEALNKGEVPAPYATKGINGLEIEAVVIDENGGATKQVEEFRNLVERQKVDAVVGYISSGDCLAVSPVAEELKTITVMHDCGTSRLFVENAKPTYLFRTGLDASVDNIALARYLVDTKPDLATYAGLEQNYAFGQDSWADFTAAMKQLKPAAKIVGEQFPKFGQGQYGAEISALSIAKPDVVHSSAWGGDMEAFVLQGTARGLFQGRLVALTCGESGFEHFKANAPNGMIIGGRGPFGAFSPDNALSRWLKAAYTAQHKESPIYPATKAAQAILGLKAAVEKAAAGKTGTLPAKEAIVQAFSGLTFESPSGTVEMSRAGGHQAVQSVSYGQYQYAGGKPAITNVKTYSGACLMAPDGTTTTDWIKAGFPGAQCEARP